MRSFFRHDVEMPTFDNWTVSNLSRTTCLLVRPTFGRPTEYVIQLLSSPGIMRSVQLRGKWWIPLGLG